MKKLVSGIMLLLLFTSMLTLAFDIQPVKAVAQTVYINADGSITPVGAPITTSDKITYDFTGNIAYPTYYGIYVDRSNVVIDGKGYTVQGNQSGNGLYLASIGNVTIKNMKITAFEDGIHLYFSSNNTVSGNNASANSRHGIVLWDHSNNNTVSGNNASANSYDGIFLFDSSNNTVSGNNASANSYDGIFLTGSSNNTVSGNNASANGSYGIILGGSSNNNTVSGNNASANVVSGINLVGSSNNTVSGNNASANGSYGIFLDGSSNNTVSGNNASANSHDGIILTGFAGSSNNTVSGNSASANSWDGIFLDGSSNNTVSGNNASSNVRDGIYLLANSAYNLVSGNMLSKNRNGAFIEASSNNTIVGNTITYNLNDGIKLNETTPPCVVNNITANFIAGNAASGIFAGDNCDHLTIARNNITANTYGVYLWGSHCNKLFENNLTANTWDGFLLHMSSINCSIYRNTIARSGNNGVEIIHDSTSNVVVGNDIANNNHGIYVDASNNGIYFNNFLGNTEQALVSTSSFGNWWDCGYPSGGNYWSDYAGVDVKSGPYQNLTGRDGIGDTNRTIDVNNVDRYPLMHAYGSVQNLNTSLIYPTIQSAINAAETLSGHVVYVKQGTYHENVVVSKSVSLLGEDMETTIIDGNMTDNVVQITSNRVTISGFTVRNGTYGIVVNLASGCTVSGNKATANQFGINLHFSTNNTVIGNHVTANTYDGIYLDTYSNNNTVSGNIVTANSRHGVVVWDHCNNNTINGNNVFSNLATALMLYYSSNNTVTGNNLTTNTRGIFLESSSNTSIIFHNNFVQNTVQAYIDASCYGNFWDNGYPSGGNYWSNYTGVDVKSGPYQNLTGRDGIGDTNHTINANNVDHYPLIRAFGSVRNLNTSLAYITIQSAIDAAETLSGHVIYVKSGTYVEQVTISKSISLLGENMETTIIDGNNSTDTTVTIQWSIVAAKISGFTIKGGNTYGIYTYSPCTITGNKVTANTVVGIRVESSDSTVSNNIVTGNGYSGIQLFFNGNSTVAGNIITNSTNGMEVLSSLDNTIVGNTVANNTYGIYFVLSTNNTVAGNMVSSNLDHGILFYAANNSRIYHNRFTNNAIQVYTYNSNNTWDDGYPSGGNYWSNYTGVDVKSGPYQNLTGRDGIGDTPHILDAINVDHYPLMKPFVGVHEIGIADVTTSKTGCLPNPTVGQGYDVDVTVEVSNYGVGSETFSLTIYANMTALKTLPVTLTGRNSATIVFTWNTAGFAKGNYTIRAYAEPVPGEIDVADNNLTGDWIIVTIPGDVTGDIWVDMQDISIMIDWFMTSPPNWNPNCDVNNDLTIDMADISIAIDNFMQT